MSGLLDLDLRTPPCTSLWVPKGDPPSHLSCGFLLAPWPLCLPRMSPALQP